MRAGAKSFVRSTYYDLGHQPHESFAALAANQLLQLIDVAPGALA